MNFSVICFFLLDYDFQFFFYCQITLLNYSYLPNIAFPLFFLSIVLFKCIFLSYIHFYVVLRFAIDFFYYLSYYDPQKFFSVNYRFSIVDAFFLQLNFNFELYFLLRNYESKSLFLTILDF